MRRFLIALLLLLPASLADAQHGGPGALCPPDTVEPSPTRLLRAISLDLRGVVPTTEEYALLEGRDDVPEALIDEWLAGEAFVERAVRRHRELLWNNLTGIDLFGAPARLIRSREPGGVFRSWRRQTATGYRGDDVPCLDRPAEFDAQGTPVTWEQPDGTRPEGWVEVSPHWAPDAPLRVCAFDAQEHAVSATGTACATRDGWGDPGCGCGPGLAWCSGPESREALMRSFGEDVERRIADNIREDRPWLELLTERAAWVNGPIVHYYRYQTGVSQGVRVEPMPVDLDALPDLEFADLDTWVRIEPGPQHSGLLTSPAWLLRFQTRRARADRFHNSFLCRAFNAPEGGLPSEGEGLPTLDLQQRDGCKYCHARLEPAAAYWGRWPENGAGWLDPERFPVARDDCLACAQTGGCGDECRRYYTTDLLGAEQRPYLGSLASVAFLRDQHLDHPDLGPRALVQASVVDGRLPACAAQGTAEWLLGRGPLDEEEEAWVDELGVDFVAGGFSWRDLVKRIVTSDVYRRVR